MSASNGDPRILRALVLTGLGLGELARLGGRWCWRTTEAYDRLVGTVSVSSASRTRTGRAVQLTRREQQILALLSLGLTAQKIGRQLFLSPRTVAKHLERMYRKFGTSDRLSTVLRAQDLGLLHPASSRLDAASGSNSPVRQQA